MNALQKTSLFPFTPMFSELFENDFFSNKFASNLPAVNIKENNTEFIVEVAAPGLKKDDFKITSEKGMINISAEHEERKEEKEENYTRKEYNYNSFSRSFFLPDDINDENIKAKYEDGILKLTLPKKVEVKDVPKKKLVNVM